MHSRRIKFALQNNSADVVEVDWKWICEFALNPVCSAGTALKPQSVHCRYNIYILFRLILHVCVVI